MVLGVLPVVVVALPVPVPPTVPGVIEPDVPIEPPMVPVVPGPVLVPSVPVVPVVAPGTDEVVSPGVLVLDELLAPPVVEPDEPRVRPRVVLRVELRGVAVVVWLSAEPDMVLPAPVCVPVEPPIVPPIEPVEPPIVLPPIEPVEPPMVPEPVEPPPVV